MKDRQSHWKEKGYTPEQIENHLRFEREKSKQSREKRKRNNLKNKDILETVRKDLLGIELRFDSKEITVTKISPTTDGKGFWFKYKATYKDGSSGFFREFFSFDDYSYDNFAQSVQY